MSDNKPLTQALVEGDVRRTLEVAVTSVLGSINTTISKMADAVRFRRRCYLTKTKRGMRRLRRQRTVHRRTGPELTAHMLGTAKGCNDV